MTKRDRAAHESDQTVRENDRAAGNGHRATGKAGPDGGKRGRGGGKGDRVMVPPAVSRLTRVSVGRSVRSATAARIDDEPAAPPRNR